MIWATVSSWSCFCWLYTASPSSAAKNIINLILVLTILWCPCIEPSLVLLEDQLPASVGSLKKQESSRKTSTSALLNTPKPLTMWITTSWKILKGMGIPDHLTYLLKNLYGGQEATVRTGHGTTEWFHIGKGVHQGYILSPCLFNLHAEYIMQNAWLKHKFKSRLPREISITSNMQMTPPLWQKVKRN